MTTSQASKGTGVPGARRRSGRDARVAGIGRGDRSVSRARARPVPGAEAGIVAARPGRLGAAAALFGLSQHDPAREAGRLSGRSRARGAPHLDHPLERARHGGARQPRLRRARRPYRELRLGRGDLRDRLQPFLPRRGRGRRRRSRVLPAAFGARRLCARLPRGAPERGGPRRAIGRKSAAAACRPIPIPG